MRDTQSNEFLKYVYDLYDATLGDNFMSPEVIEPKKKGFFASLFKSDKDEEYVESAEEEKAYEKKSILIHSINTNPVSFDRIWDFCEFIRVAEKVFFYKNAPEDEVYVEMNLSDSSSPRKMRINYSNAEIRFVLEHSLLHSDILSITIVRHFGLNMETKYKIVDGDMGGYKDSSDLYMINEINRILRNTMCSKFEYIMCMIYMRFKGKEV